MDKPKCKFCDNDAVRVYRDGGIEYFVEYFVCEIHLEDFHKIIMTPTCEYEDL